jgi:hypothetical protein
MPVLASRYQARDHGIQQLIGVSESTTNRSVVQPGVLTGPLHTTCHLCQVPCAAGHGKHGRTPLG